MNKYRWPPVYDFEGLLNQIKTLLSNNSLFKFYYSDSPQKNPLQGDIIELSAEFPFITKDGDIAVEVNPINFWLVVGNTCDLTPNNSNGKFTNIIPLEALDKNAPSDILINLRKYTAYKKFFIPTWDKRISKNGFVADFRKITTIEKQVVLSNETTKIKEMTQLSWILLHSCLVRYLARDDGRHD